MKVERVHLVSLLVDHQWSCLCILLKGVVVVQWFFVWLEDVLFGCINDDGHDRGLFA